MGNTKTIHRERTLLITGPLELGNRKRYAMHNLLVVVAFFGMLLAPCIVTAFSGVENEE
jgi:hypothetical protein